MGDHVAHEITAETGFDKAADAVRFGFFPSRFSLASGLVFAVKILGGGIVFNIQLGFQKATDRRYGAFTRLGEPDQMMDDFAHGLLARCARWPEGLELFQVGLRVYRDGAFHDLFGLDIDDFRLADLRPGFLVLFLLVRNLLAVRGGGGLATI